MTVSGDAAARTGDRNTTEAIAIILIIIGTVIANDVINELSNSVETRYK